MARRINRGDRLPGIPADDWNEFVEAADKINRLAIPQVPTGAVSGAHALSFVVFNKTIVDISSDFPVLKLNAPSVTADDNPDVAFEPIYFDGVVPDSGNIADVAILQGPVNKDESNAGVWSGPTWAIVQITDEIHTRAIPIAGNVTNLVSASGSGAQILWKPAGTGLKKCLVLLGTTINPIQLAVVLEIETLSGFTQDRYANDDSPIGFDFAINDQNSVKVALLEQQIAGATSQLGIYNPNGLTLEELAIVASDMRKDGTPTVGEVVYLFTDDGSPALPGEGGVIDAQHAIYCDVLNDTDYLRGLPTWDLPTAQILFHDEDDSNLQWIEASLGGGTPGPPGDDGKDGADGDQVVEGYAIDIEIDGADHIIDFDPTEISGFADTMQLFAHFSGDTDPVDPAWKTATGYVNSPTSPQLLVNFDGSWQWEGLNNYDDSANEQAIIHINGNWQWVTAWQVKVVGTDPTPTYLHDAFQDNTAATYLAQDILIKNQTAPRNETEILFWDVSVTPGHSNTLPKVLTLSSGTPIWADSAGGGGGDTVAEGDFIDITGTSPKTIHVDLFENGTFSSGEQQFLVHFSGVTDPADWVWQTVGNYNESPGSEQVIVNEGGDVLTWRTAYQVKVSGDDTTANYLLAKFKDASTYVSGDDILVHAQETDGPGDENVRLFIDTSLISEHTPGTPEILMHDASDDAKWKTIVEMLKLLSGYVSGNNQSIGHDANMDPEWQDDTTCA